MAETWRVVLASGEVREVRAPEALRDDAARVAVLRECALWHLPAREILAPGELTRAELRAQAWREGAEAIVLRPVDIDAAPVEWTAEDEALADGDRRALDAAERERDEARVEVARLRADLGEVRAALKGSQG